jgi:hypothetical protein
MPRGKIWHNVFDLEAFISNPKVFERRQDAYKSEDKPTGKASKAACNYS